MTIFDFVCKFNISKRVLARQLEINESTLYNYLNGTRTPGLEVAAKIVDVTDGHVSYHDLIVGGFKPAKTKYEVSPNFEAAEGQAIDDEFGDDL